jgi:hypothetical protein
LSGGPDFLRQAEIPASPDDQRKWVDACRKEATAAGCQFSLVSACPPGVWPGLNLIIFEAWKERQEILGEPNWQLTHANPNDPAKAGEEPQRAEGKSHDGAVSQASTGT